MNEITPNPQEQIAALQEQLIQIRKRDNCPESEKHDRRAEECEILGKLGIVYYQGQQWQEALATLTEYLNFARELGNQWQEAVAQYYLGFSQQAIDEYWQAVEAFSQAYRLFRQQGQEEFYSQVWQQLIQQGQVYFEQKQFTEALALYKQQLKLLLEFYDLKTANWLAIDIGKIYYYQNDLESALSGHLGILDAAQIFNDRPMESLALAWVGCSYRELGDLEQGLTYLERRLAVVQELGDRAAQKETLGWLIDISQRLERFDRTVEYYQVQLGLFRELKEPLSEYSCIYDLALFQYHCQKYQEALSGFKTALEIAEILYEDSQKSYKIASARYMLGECYRNLGKNQEAISDYEQAVELYLQLGVKDWAKKGLEHLVNLYRELQQVEQEIDCQKKRLQLIQDREDQIAAQSLAYGIGNLYNHRQQFTQALEYYQEALILAKKLAQQQNLANAAYMVADCYRNLGQKEAAISWYEQAVELYLELGIKDWAEKALDFLVNFYREGKESEKEIRCQQRRLKLFQDSGDRISEQSCLYNLAMLQFNNQQYQEGLSGFETALQIAESLDEDSQKSYKIANARYMLGQCCRNLGQKEAAISWYEQAVELYVGLKETKWALSGLEYLVNLYRESKEYEKEIDCQQRRLEIFRELGDRASEQSCLYNLAMLQFNNQQYQEALSGFETALQFAETLDEDSGKTCKIANSRYMLGDCYRNLGEQEPAISWYEQAVGLYVEVKETKWALSGLEYLVNLYRELKQDERVIASYQRRLEIFRELKEPISEYSCLYELARFQFNYQKYQEALSGFETALQLAEILDEDSSKTYKIANSRYMLGQCCRNLGQQQSAISWYEQAVGLYVEVKETKWALSGLEYLVNLHRELKQYDQAIACQKQRLNIFRQEGDATAGEQSCLYGIGCVYDDQKQWEQAIEYFESALQLARDLGQNDKQANAHYMLGKSYRKLKQLPKAIDNYEQAINLYQEAKDIKWAAISSHYLANLYYYDLPLGKADSIEKAIEIYAENLSRYTRSYFPKDWAMTQNSLGDAYFQRILGEKSENLETAIRHYEAALKVYTREAYPQDWAMVQVNLGRTYRNRIEGEKVENCNWAIACYQAALEVRNREADPEKWASLQNRLGNIYSDEIPGDKAENLETAIRYYEAALEVYTREEYPEDWARTQNNLGLTYVDRIRGEKADNLEKGIAAFNAALQVYTREEYSQDWAMVQMHLGIAYTWRIQGEEVENVEIAISYHNAALTVYTREEYLQDWAMTQMNLGLAYSHRIHGDKTENQEISLAFYNAALEVLTRQEFPEYWAKVQLNLGVAYSKRIQGDKAENLEKTIAFDNAALEVFTQETFPEEWAMVQMNLGTHYRKRIKGQKSQNWEIAIAYYTSALEVFTKQAFPENWASGQNRLGNIYLKRICGNQAENLDQAFRYYNAALEVYTRKNYPEDWAAIQNDVGIIYYKQLQGNKAKNLEMAIAAYERALEINSYYEANPEDWAITQNNLGNAYRNRIKGEKAHNLEIALAAYKSALIVRTPEKYPEDWADTQYKIGFTYINRIQGEKADNIEKAIIAYENALEIYIEKVCPSGDNSAKSYFDLDSQAIIEDDYNSRKSAIVISDGDSESHDYNYWVNQCVSLQMNLARSYVNRIKGDKSENLGKAIDYHKAALKLRPREAFPEEWAEIKLLLGLAYTDQILTNQDKRFLSEAIRCYQAALEIRTLEKVPEQWADIQYFIGNSYYFTHQHNLEYGEQAIIAYEAALTMYSQDNNPQRWAEIQNFLGLIYRRRTRGNMADNIEKAIAYHQNALTAYTKDLLPEEWANTQNYLGIAYDARIQGDKSDNKEKAIAAHQQAFTVFTKDDYPQEWAHTQVYFGNAYLSRVLGKKADNLQIAINCYQSALTVFTKEQYPDQWAMCQNNVGQAYKDLMICARHLDNWENALTACLASLSTFNRDTNPEFWANLNFNIGDIYNRAYHFYEQKEEFLEQARFYFEQGLTVFTRESYPERWATAQKCLTATYDKSAGTPDDLEKVMELYKNSLEVFTYKNFPEEHSKVLFSLGVTYYNNKNYQSAYNTFAEAIDTVDYLRGEIISGDEVKRKINERWVELYLLMVKVCIQLNRYDKALEYADRSKARNLSELIAARDLYGSDIPESTRLRLQQIRQDIAQEKERLQQTSQLDSNYLNQLREEFNRLSPYQPLLLDDIKNLLNEETAIIEWYVSFQSNQFLTFTILPNLANQPSQPDSGISLWQSSPEDFKNLIDWGNAYLHDYLNNKTQWQNNLPQRLETLAQILHLDEILHNLREKFPNCKKLILIPHRFLHLFPIHALPVSVGVVPPCLPQTPEGATTRHRLPLQEIFPNGVSYSPNCQVLQQAQKRQQKRPNFNQLFAIQNPTEDLDFTDIEVEAIKNFFDPHHVLKHEDAEKTALDFHNAHCTHFSCHGYFNFEDALKSALILAKSEFAPPPPEDDPTRYLPLKDGNHLDLGKCLTIEDILRLDLTQCRLVTLSACETGITDFNSTSDEYIGLPSGFILAGSPNVVSTLWTVNDLSSALLMIRFYQNLKNGETVPLALKHAQIWLRDATAGALQQWSGQLELRSTYRQQLRRFSKMDSMAKPFSSPYYWAGFCAISA